MKTKIIYLYIFIFLYVSILSLFLQLYFYPEYLENFYYKDGMLNNGDWIRYNEIALSQLASMKENGLKAWSLYPLANDKVTTHSISGLVSLFYYFTHTDTPYFLVPLHALVYATASIYLLLSLILITKEIKLSILSIFIFISLPSASLYFTHINKEIFFWFSISVIFYNSLFYLNIIFSKLIFSKIYLFNIFILFFAIFLIFVLRPQFLQICTIIFTILLFFISILKYNKLNKFYIGLNFFLIFFFIVFNFIYTSPIQKSINTAVEKNYKIVNYNDNLKNLEDTRKKINKIKQNLNIKIKDTKSLDSTTSWKQNYILPHFVDKFFFKIYKVRNNFIISEKATIDNDKALNSIYRIVGYYPVSIFKGYFLPFINEWLNKNELFGDKVKFLFVYEMLIIYLGIIFIIFYLMFNLNYNILYLVLFSSFFISIIVYLYPNIGTLFRYRFFFINLVTITGWVYFFLYISKKINKKI